MTIYDLIKENEELKEKVTTLEKEIKVLTEVVNQYREAKTNELR